MLTEPEHTSAQAAPHTSGLRIFAVGPRCPYSSRRFQHASGEDPLSCHVSPSVPWPSPLSKGEGRVRDRPEEPVPSPVLRLLGTFCSSGLSQGGTHWCVKFLSPISSGFGVQWNSQKGILIRSSGIALLYRKTHKNVVKTVIYDQEIGTAGLPDLQPSLTLEHLVSWRVGGFAHRENH